MSEFKVRAVEFEEKSAVEIEQELVDKHEKEVNGETVEESSNEPKEVTEETVVKDEESEQAVPVTYDIKDEDVLSHIKNRYNKEINSLDDLFAQREANDELPEDAAAFLKFKRETGRGIDDFVKLNKDFSKMKDKDLLAEYYSTTNMTTLKTINEELHVRLVNIARENTPMNKVEEKIRETLIGIIKDVLREVVPEEKNSRNWEGLTPEEKLLDAIYKKESYLDKEYEDGWNDCREEIKSRINKIIV